MMHVAPRSPRVPQPRAHALFHPGSVAIVGAGRERGGIGRQILENLIAAQFCGPIYPIHPLAARIADLPAYPSIEDTPDPVDLVILCVPAEKVVPIVHACGRKGVNGIVIITAGFRETGPEGEARERALKEALDLYGIPAIGPNCMGILNTDPAVQLNATFSPAHVHRGKVAFVSQSGALGLAILAQADKLGIGLSYFASLGNKTNTSTNDLLEAWEHDPDVELILLYLENFGNPRKFVELARRITRTKPIIVVKSGRTAAGARAARSHTGALAERDATTDALFEQCGVLRARSIGELFDLAQAFSHAPVPQGERVAIVTNSGGPGIMATDALDEHGLKLASLAPATIEALRAGLSRDASVQNPVDVVAGGGPEAFALATRELLADPNVDALLAIYTPPVFVDQTAVMRAIADAPRGGKPVLACVLGRGGEDATHRILTQSGIPAYTFPESAVRSLAALAGRARMLQRDVGTRRGFDDADVEAAAGLLAKATLDPQGWMRTSDALALLACYRIPVSPAIRVTSASDAAAAMARLGGRVAMKAEATGLVHKSDAGGVILDVATPEAAQEAYGRLERAMRAHHLVLDAALVQPMLGGTETILGVTSDPKFGPLVMFGLGGIFAEILHDVAFRLAPLTDLDARRLVRSIRAWPMLDGARGAARADTEALEDTILRLSALAVDHPRIAEIDINPLFVRVAGSGVAAPDARVRLWPNDEPPRAPSLPADVAASRG